MIWVLSIFTDIKQSAEAAIVQLFAEVKRHKPSVIYLPGIDNWYHTLSEAVITTFMGLLRAIPPTDPVLVLGIADAPEKDLDKSMIHELFGYSKKNKYTIERPTKVSTDGEDMCWIVLIWLAKPSRFLLDTCLLCEERS